MKKMGTPEVKKGRRTLAVALAAGFILSIFLGVGFAFFMELFVYKKVSTIILYGIIFGTASFLLEVFYLWRKGVRNMRISQALLWVAVPWIVILVGILCIAALLFSLAMWALLLGK